MCWDPVITLRSLGRFPLTLRDSFAGFSTGMCWRQSPFAIVCLCRSLRLQRYEECTIVKVIWTQWNCARHQERVTPLRKQLAHHQKPPLDNPLYYYITKYYHPIMHYELTHKAFSHEAFSSQFQNCKSTGRFQNCRRGDETRELTDSHVMCAGRSHESVQN